MAKLMTLAFLLAALLAVSAVSARTTITTTVVEDDIDTNPGRQEGSCQEQVRRQDNFNMCQRFLMERSQGGSSSYSDELAMVTGGRNPEQRGEHLKECCTQMENVSEECRCEGLSMMMRQQRQRGQRGQREQMEEMLRVAGNLPSMCNLEPRQCTIETSMF